MHIRAMTLNDMALIALAGIAVYAAMVGPDAAARNLSRGLFGLADDLFAGAIEGLGQVVGVPTTSPDKCAAAMARGAAMDASFYCDAATYIRWISGGGARGGATGKW